MMINDPNITLVYSTESGKIENKPQPIQIPQGDGVVRIYRDNKNRKGKGVAVIKGLGLDENALKQLAQKLKKQCGCGGTVKAFDIEIQTGNREQLKTILERLNYRVKLAGG